MKRRSFITGSIALTMLPAVPIMIRPDILSNPIWNNFRCREFVEIFRSIFLEKLSDKFTGELRNISTKRINLLTKYDFDITYDGIPPGGWPPIWKELSNSLVDDIGNEFDNLGKIRLVALDTTKVIIDPLTFLPYVEFYIDVNI